LLLWKVLCHETKVMLKWIEVLVVEVVVERRYLPCLIQHQQWPQKMQQEAVPLAPQLCYSGLSSLHHE